MIRPHLDPLLQGEEAGFAAGEGHALNKVPHQFAELVVHFDISSRSAALNMAIDEALLERVAKPTIRFYRWDHRALSFGYFGRFADVARYASERDLVRRWTGGGIVFHDEDLTYSLVIPPTNPVFSESSMSIYEKVHRVLSDALVAAGKEATLARRHALLRVRDMQKHVPPICFANPVSGDLMIDCRKIAGAAQRRTRRGLLHQGSIQNVELEDGLATRFSKALSRKCSERRIDRDILDRAEEIAIAKYATGAWLRKR